MKSGFLRSLVSVLDRLVRVEAAGLFALQKLDRARRHHRELVDAADPEKVRRLAMAVEHDWHLLDDAAQQLREALHIEGELT